MRRGVPGVRVIGNMLRPVALLLAWLPLMLAHGQTPPVTPVSAIWAGEWRAADFNLPPVNKTLTTRRNAATLEIKALRLTRSLPPDNYRVVRASCAALPATDDRFYLLKEGRRLFEFRFPQNGLSLNVTVYERVR